MLPPTRAAAPGRDWTLRARSMGLDGFAMLCVSSLALVATAGVSYVLCLALVLRAAVGARPAVAGAEDGFWTVIVPGVALDRQGGPRPDFEHRLEAALKLKAARLILLGGVTGGAGGPSEADAGRAWLLAHGASDAAIRRETVSRNTVENLRRLRDILAEEPGRAILISNRYHLARVRALAVGLGMTIDLRAAESQTPWNLHFAGRATLEAFYIHWYYAGHWTARLLGSRRMLARIS